MPPSAASKRRLTPTERAAADAQRLKDAKDRHAQKASPGPGAYDPGRPKSSSGGSGSAFKSTTDRSKRIASSPLLNCTGDPGAYETASGRHTIAAQALSSSHSSASKKGTSGFGGTSKRELKLASSPTSPGSEDAIPGPGAYSPMMTEKGRESDMHVRNGVENMKSAAFASATQRKGVSIGLPGESQPGPGAYNPSFETINPRITHTVSKTGRDGKFTGSNMDGTGDDCTTGAHVGPGSYDGSGPHTIAKELSRGGHVLSASMVSDSARPISADLW